MRSGTRAAQTTSRTKKQRLYWLLLCAAIMLLLVTIAAACESRAPGLLGGAAPGHPSFSASPSSQLIVQLGFPGEQLIVDNGNDYVWRDVSIRLNDSYLYSTPLLPRGASSIPLSEFVDADGHSFVPSAMTPHRLIVEVRSGFQGKPGYFVW
ncbi:hypothetical protein [Paenibacillus rigui]|uniref:Uncharacterized protein n=1 Tax=Paenibacillus rigui TaxID=554312 RepID=A0A229UHE2_9BACL|nr:hypothetical protein [Paenibacillus rigui]OXM82804.1 hypothetical protein CF651_29515 [Paenibacillus rigui]